MIELFVTDIDGCLAEPYERFDLEGVTTLRQFAETADRSRDTPTAPALTICSGRPYPYVESLTQILGITTPALFESGGGRFDPVSARTVWNPRWTPELEATMEDIQHWLLTECIPGTKLMLDHAKRTQAGIITPDEEEILELRPRVERYVEEHAPPLRVFTTDNSIDVVPPDITKKQGLEWLASTLEIDMSEIAYIGDTNGDLEALEAVGTSFAPANAHDVVRSAVDHVTEGAVMEGTLEAYRHCRAQNERRVRA